jgi:hypothetical protein
LSEIRETEAKSMSIKIGPAPLALEAIGLLRSTLQKYSGEKPFTFSVQAPEATSVTITPDERINFSPALIEELEELLPLHTLEFSY